MKTGPSQKALTFGDFISSGYEIFGKRHASGIVMNAVNAQLLQFRGKRTFYVS